MEEIKQNEKGIAKEKSEPKRKTVKKTELKEKAIAVNGSEEEKPVKVKRVKPVEGGNLLFYTNNADLRKAIDASITKLKVEAVEIDDSFSERFLKIMRSNEERIFKTLRLAELFNDDTQHKVFESAVIIFKALTEDRVDLSEAEEVVFNRSDLVKKFEKSTHKIALSLINELVTYGVAKWISGSHMFSFVFDNEIQNREAYNEAQDALNEYESKLFKFERIAKKNGIDSENFMKLKNRMENHKVYVNPEN